MTENTIKNFIKLSRDIDDAGNLTDAGQIVAHIGATKTFNVTVAAKTAAHRYNGSGSGNGYVIDGVEAPHIELLPDVTYRFDQSDSSNSGHPLLFYYEADKTTQYSTGVTTNGTPGTAGAYTEISVTDSTPSALYYQCSAHAYMGNAVSTPPSKNLTVGGNITSNGNVTSTGSITAGGDIKASSFNGGQLGGRRNLVINGAMQVAQRGTQETGITVNDYYTVDRFKLVPSGATLTMDQNTVTDLPGFTKSCKATCTLGGTPSAGQIRVIGHRLEAQNLQHLKKGTSDAESVTLSFWVKSGVTGTYTFEIYEDDNARSIAATYTIDTANTWEYKTITFAGDTTGAITNDNGIGFFLNWILGAGSDFTAGTFNTSWHNYTAADRVSPNQVDVASGNNSAVNYFEITGIQLEVGDTATPFEYLSYGEELALCQRYYQNYPVINATCAMFTAVGIGGTSARASLRPYGGLMRDEPSIYTPTNVYLKGNGSSITVTSIAASGSQGGGHAFNFTVASGIIADHVYYVTGSQVGGGVFELDAEL